MRITNGIHTMKTTRKEKVFQGLIALLQLVVVVSLALAVLWLFGQIPSVGSKGSEWHSSSYYESRGSQNDLR